MAKLSAYWLYAWYKLGCSLEREQGQDIVEYALLCGALSITAVAIIVLIGPYMRSEFGDIANALNMA